MSVETRCDVAIVGAGPAGLAAATELAANGVEHVLVLERDTVAGGVPRHCGHYPFGLRESGRLCKGPEHAARLVARAGEAGVEIRCGASVIAVEPGPRLVVSSDAGTTAVVAKRVLLATGARETSRAARLVGGTKPKGVVSAGTLQSLVYLAGRRPFRRPVVVGTELVSFSTLLTCRHAGIRPVAMIEAASRTTAFAATRHFPTLLGMALWFDTELVSIEGDRSVTGVLVRDATGRERRIDCDGVVVTGRFRPDASLLAGSHLLIDAASGGPVIDQLGRASDPNYHVAGNLLRAVETAGHCWHEGRLAARTLLRDLAGELPRDGRILTLLLDDDQLRYGLPQRWYPGRAGRLQCRVAGSVRGQLELWQGAHRIARRRLVASPERRVFLPVPALRIENGDNLSLRLRKDHPWRLRASPPAASA